MFGFQNRNYHIESIQETQLLANAKLDANINIQSYEAPSLKEINHTETDSSKRKILKKKLFYTESK